MNGFMYDEIEKNGGWNEEGKLFIPESCYECILMEDVFNSYSKCRADGKEIPLPYKKCKEDCPIRKTVEATRFVPDSDKGALLRNLYILKVFASGIPNADKVIDQAIKEINLL